VLLADLLRRVLHRRAPDQRVLEVRHCPVADASEWAFNAAGLQVAARA
jgi:hypothetical protein